MPSIQLNRIWKIFCMIGRHSSWTIRYELEWSSDDNDPTTSRDKPPIASHYTSSLSFILSKYKLLSSYIYKCKTIFLSFLFCIKPIQRCSHVGNWEADKLIRQSFCAVLGHLFLSHWRMMTLVILVVSSRSFSIGKLVLVWWSYSMHTLKLMPCMCLVICFDGDCARITLVLDPIHVSTKNIVENKKSKE